MLAATAFGLVESTAIKKYNTKYDGGGFLFTAMVSFFSMLFFLLRYLITDSEKGDFTLRILPYAFIAGVFYCTASFLTYIALQIGPFAISILILSYGIVITSLYGILFLNEKISYLGCIGFGLIIISLFLLRGRDDNESKSFSYKWLICIALSVFCSSGFSIVTKMQQVTFSDSVNNEFKIISLAVSATILLIVGAFNTKGGMKRILKTGAPYSFMAGMSNGANNMLGMLINTMVPLSISSPTRSVMKTLLTFAVAYFVIRERFLPRQLIGVLLSTVAVIIINVA